MQVASSSRPELLPTATFLGAREEIDDIEAHTQPGTLNIGTRASRLALVQAELVKAALAREWPDLTCQLAPMTTAGDKNQSQALYLMEGKALWTQELEVALLEGAIDIVVHSLKDMPTTLASGCEIGAIMEREDPRDALVVKRGLPYTKLEDLPSGAVIGTSSVRRVAQMRRAFPHLVFADVRGNLCISGQKGVKAHAERVHRNTRLSKLDDPKGPFAAIILAVAGLKRLGLGDRITSTMSAPNMLHAVGQGALGLEIRSNDPAIAQMVSVLEHWQSAWCCLAERELLRVLEGGCSVPVGCQTSLEELDVVPNGHINGTVHESSATAALTATYPLRTARLTLDACVTSLNGQKYVHASATRTCRSAADAEDLGRSVAHQIIEDGGRAILLELGKRLEDASFAAKHQAAVQKVVERSQYGVSPTTLDDVHCG